METVTQNSDLMPYVDLPPRFDKPRSEGLTIVTDRAMSSTDIRGLIEVAGGVVDLAKFTDHAGIATRFRTDFFRQRNQIWREAGVRTFPGGLPFEMALLNGRGEAYIEMVAELGFSGVEISENLVEPMPLPARQALIRRCRGLGLFVFTELGRKMPDNPLTFEEAWEMAAGDLESGAETISLDISDVKLLRSTDPAPLHRILEEIGRDRIVFEAGPGGFPEMAIWLVHEFGPNVNLENINPGEVILLEAIRMGINRNEGFSYFTSRGATGA